MITLIHGDDITASHNYYLTERQKASEKKIVDGNSITITDLMQVFSGNGLFGDQESIFIEDLVSKRKSSKVIEELTGFIISQTDANVTLWESKQLTPKQIALFKKADINEFKTPTVVFAFLDSIRPRNTQQMIKLYHEILEREDAMYVLVMLIRQVRILIALQQQAANRLQTTDQSADRVDSSPKAISEVMRMAPWQKGKLEKQAKMFGQEQLLDFHAKLFELENGQKTGGLASPLNGAIDFFLASI